MDFENFFLSQQPLNFLLFAHQGLPKLITKMKNENDVHWHYNWVYFCTILIDKLITQWTTLVWSNFTLCCMRQDPCIFRSFHHGHLLVTRMCLTNDIASALPNNEKTIFATTLQYTLYFKTARQLQQWYSRLKDSSSLGISDSWRQRDWSDSVIDWSRDTVKWSLCVWRWIGW